MKPETGTKVKYGVWGLILGAGIAIIIGFAWGGWITRGSSLEVTDAALLTTRSAICVAQFMKQPNAQEKLKEFGEVSPWKRATFIEERDWDKMPGEEEPAPNVARACVDGLEFLMEK